MRPKIFITGDSWGVKEWTRNNVNDSAEEIERKDNSSHRGLQTYFEQDGFEVHNKSSGGSSNKDSIIRLMQYLDKEKGLYNKEIDIIFWIITDPIRDLRPYATLSSEVCANNGWNNLIRKLFHDQCLIADNVAEERQLKIHMIGGVASFNASEVSAYKNLIPVVPSWHDLLLSPIEKDLVPSNTVWTSQTSDVHISTLDLDYIKSIGGEKLVKTTVDEFWTISEFHRIIYNSNRFFELDNSHPDRHAHKILYEKLLTYIKNGTN